MTALKTAGTVAVGMLATLSVAAFGQNGAGQDPAPRGATATLVLESADQLGRLDWIEKSEVAALREGVIEKMELREGDPAIKDQPIGYLHKEVAELTVAKNALMASNTAAIEKGQAAWEVALTVVARNKRLNERKPGMVSQEDVAKAEGELKVAVAQINEAKEQVAINKAELNLAKQMLKEHTIVAPFNGIVIKRMKHPGESVRANEAVVEIGNLARLWAEFHVPLEYALRVKEGQIVEIQPRLVGTRGDQPIERMKFRGKISFVNPEIQPVGETAVLIRAEFDNPNFELRPGFKVAATIFLTDDVASRTPQPTAR
ncbi:efflux RND transporter periplasmic adaptor subunit [Paludisphaera borealis]|uniref:Macrolide export protein MacA n=1 Tax=Paludisphaera borealis TaxID=1387353 RepID=A0A1U7CKC7_9BACT|nr:efflux RND transporter periplasmic adaptor subunit [Paludisphaera borealis]APW59358.1 Macrolide export protein MacA [Paludisphaera borealis]MDR3618845.1 efflux RND transporter periplasmic adaptor subunit [Paludisphaera borealis]